MLKWEILQVGFMIEGQYNLIRLSDEACLFATSKVNTTTGLLYSGKPPKLFGIIASVKSKGWILEISQEYSNHSHKQIQIF